MQTRLWQFKGQIDLLESSEIYVNSVFGEAIANSNGSEITNQKPHARDSSHPWDQIQGKLDFNNGMYACMYLFIYLS